jgi:HEAT repeat protein
MTTKKTLFSTSRKLAAEQREAIDAVIDSLDDRVPTDISDDDFEEFSDLSRASADRLQERWLEISYPVRLALVREMVSRFETDIEHHYDRALIAALFDEEVDVKLSAFEGLTDTTDERLLTYLVERLPEEDSAPVRAAGSRVAGQFVLKAQLGDLEPGTTDRLREVVLGMLENDPDPDVRLYMLEAAGYFAEDPDVVDAIEDAWNSGSHDAQVSAVRAMGHQCDPRWLDIVLQQFRSDEPELRFEAARSAATVGNQNIVPQLIQLTDDEDVEVQMAAIASLGSLGGKEAIATLRALEESESPAIADAAGAAVEEALLATTVARPPSSLW